MTKPENMSDEEYVAIMSKYRYDPDTFEWTLKEKKMNEETLNIPAIETIQPAAKVALNDNSENTVEAKPEAEVEVTEPSAA